MNRRTGSGSPDARQRLALILREAKQRLLGPRADGVAALPEEPAASNPAAFDIVRQHAAEAGILEAIATDAPLPDMLRGIALAVDALNPGIASSILLLDADGVHLRHGAAPHLPESLIRAFEGQPIGPNAGSCGTAAFTGHPVIVPDIATDPRWTGFREPLQALGFRACWSVPVFDAEGRVIATFALYGREATAPDDGQIEMIARFARLVGIAIDRTTRRDALRASEERFRSIYRSVPVSIWEEDWSGIIAILDELRAQGIHDFRRHAATHPEIMSRMIEAMHILGVNEPTLLLFGARDKEELERLLKMGALAQDIGTAIADQIAGLAEGRSIFEGERIFRTRAGETIHTVMRIAYPASGSGSSLVLVSLMDVTAQKRLEAERAILAARLGATLENMTDAFCLVDRDWRFVYLNAEAERVLQRSRERLLGRSMWDEFPDARGSEIYRMYERAMREGTLGHLEFFYEPLDEWLDIRAHPSVDGLAIYFRTITERRRLDDKLRQSEERFRAIARATADIVWDWDLKEQKVWWTDRVSDSAIYPGGVAHVYATDEWSAAIHPDDRKRVVAGLVAALDRRDERWVAQYRYTDNKGGWIDVEDHGQLILNESGEPSRMVGGMTDITERKRLEARLAENEERFRIVASATSDILWDWDLRAGQLWWSDRAAKDASYPTGPTSAADFGATLWEGRLHPDDQERVVASLLAAIDRRDERWVEQYRYRDDCGEWLDIEDHARLFFDESGAPVRMVGGMTDIALRKRLEARLAESEERFRTIARATADLVWDWDLRTQKVWWADRQQDSTLFPLEDGEFGPDSWAGRIHPDDRDRVTAGIRGAIERRDETWTDQYRFLGPDNRETYIEDHGRLMFDETGTPVRFVGGMTDISERKRMETKLRENEERFRLIADTAADRFWDWNLETGMLWWAGQDGGSGEADIGAAIGRDLGDRIWGDRLHPEDRERVVTSFIDAIERRDRKWFAQYRYRSGDEIWIEIEDRGQLIFDANGKLTRFMGSMTDITDKKRLDAQLRESEERFRIIARTTADVVWDWDLIAGTTWRSEGMYGRFGNPDGTNVSFDDWKSRVHPDDRDRILAGLQETVDRGEGEWFDQYRFLDMHGVWIDIEDHGRIVVDETGRAIRFVGGMTDITARKQAERALRERIKELACLYRAVELTTNDDRPVDSICADIAAILPESLLHDDIAVARIVVEGGEQRSVGWQTPLSALTAPIRVESRDIGFVEVGLTAARPDEEGGHDPFLREERALVNAVATHIGRMIGDRRMSETLMQSERLRSVGELTGGVAHDFNNLLTIILGNAEILAERLKGRPDLRPLAETAMSAAERGAELTSRLLSFARRQALEPVATDMNRLVAGMGGLLHRTLGEQVEIETRLGEGLRLSLVDAPRLENALLNLCINARDAMPQGGRLTIETRNVELDADYCAMHDDVTPGRYVMIAVSDTGTGMTPKVVARAFDPFFTTKDVGKGSGLGLSMVYGFVKQSKGHISVYSEPGHGTTVRLYLPEAVNGTAADVSVTEASAPPRGSEKILLVEDDDLVREHVRAQLEGLGYRVVAAENGREAIAVLHAGENFDLLFTDVVMPGGMNGRELADAVRAIRPDLPVLFTSGYTEDAIMHHGRLDSGVQLLSKPYRRQELATKIRIALGD